MKGSIRHIFTNAIIMLMAVFVCLPCSVKREIKQAFDIPVTHSEHSEQPNKAIVCLTFTKKENQKVSISYQKKVLPKHHYKFGFAFYQTDVSLHTIFPHAEIKIPASVPIYILHEQYRI